MLTLWTIATLPETIAYVEALGQVEYAQHMAKMYARFMPGGEYALHASAGRAG